MLQKLQTLKKSHTKELGLSEHETAWNNWTSVSQTDTNHSNSTIVCLSAHHKEDAKWNYGS